MKSPACPDAVAPGYRFRLRFAKRSVLRLVSHHDLLRCLERCLRRAELPVARTQGFNPRPKLVFPLALGLGIEAHREVLDLELTEPYEPSRVLAELSRVAPEGLVFLEAERVESHRAPRVVSASYRFDVPDGPDRDRMPAAIASFLASASVPYVRRRPDRTIDIDLRPFVLELLFEAASGTLLFRLKVTPEGSARPEEIVEALGLRHALDQGQILARTEVELAPTHIPSPAIRESQPSVPSVADSPDPDGHAPERTTS